MNRFAALSVILLLMCGCTQTVTKSGLNAKASEHNGFTFPEKTYYIGSKDGYDYFAIRSGLAGSTKTFRVIESEGTVTNRFPVTKDETRWRGYGYYGISITNTPIPASK